MAERGPSSNLTMFELFSFFSIDSCRWVQGTGRYWLLNCESAYVRRYRSECAQ